MTDDVKSAVQVLLARQAIRDSLHRYARGVDRGEWDLVRSTYHVDAVDDHVDFRGNVDELIEWLAHRFAGADNSVHFLGSSLMEFVDAAHALVETYFVSSRVLAPPSVTDADLATGDAICRQSWGRYIDRFEFRDEEWRVARRSVIVDSRFRVAVAQGLRVPGHFWGMRDGSDPLWVERRELGLPAS